MATKNGNNGRFDIYTENPYISGYVRWQETYDDSTYISTNKTKVTIDVFLHRTNIYSGTVSINAGGTRKAYFGSDVVENNDTLNFTIAGNSSSSGGAYTHIYSASKEITHNSDGSKNIDLGFYMTNVLSDSWAGAFKVAKTLSNVTLMKIPRYGTCNQNIVKTEETTVKIDWSSDSTVDYIWCSTNDGYSWTAVSEVNAKSGTYTIYGLSPNTLYNVRTRIRRKDSQLTTDSSRSQITTYDYPHCTDTPNFTIGEELTLKLYNPLSRLVTVAFIGANGESLSTDQTAMTTVRGYNSETFKDKLYKSIPNSTEGQYQIKVTYEGVTKTRNNNNKYYVNTSECTPTFEDFIYIDGMGRITDITRNNQILVKDLSWLHVIIDTANKMVTKKYATPVRYTATFDTLYSAIGYSEDRLPLDIGIPRNSGTKRLTVTAHDSRGLTKSVYKDIVVYDYTKPVINATVTRLNNFEAQTTLKVNGTFTKLNIDGSEKNGITGVQYRYRETNGTWSSWTTLSTTVTNGTFTCSDIILSLDITKSFEFEIQAVDNFESNSLPLSLAVGQAIFFISTNKKACYINGDKILTAKEIYPIGSIYMSINDTNPSDLFGGTWEQLKDRFLLGAGDTYSNGTTGGEATHRLTIEEMPSHSHEVKIAYPFTAGGTRPYVPYAGNSDTYATGVYDVVQYNGGSQPHNNMPPYLTVYMWKRIA